MRRNRSKPTAPGPMRTGLSTGIPETLETVPSVLYILMRYGDDPEEAILRAVNDTKDNDTIAAIVGAAVGALHGRRALPGRWIKNLSGRTTDRDDDRVFELITDARRAF